MIDASFFLPNHADAFSIAALYAALLGVVFVALTSWVSTTRAISKTVWGTGPARGMLDRSIRAHGNFSEQVPLSLILLAFVAASVESANVVHYIGGGLLLSRLAMIWAHATSTMLSAARVVGSLGNQIVLISSCWIILSHSFASTISQSP